MRNHRHGGQTVGAALAGFMYALVGGVNNTVSTGLASVNNTSTTCASTCCGLHDDHVRVPAPPGDGGS